MNNMLNFMDKIYGDTKTLSIIYIVGAVLLFIFIVLLIFSLRKTDKKDEPKIIEEPNDIDKEIKEDPKKEEKTDIKEETKEEELVDNKDEEKADLDSSQSIFEKTTIIPVDEINTDPIDVPKEDNIEKALDNVENNKIETDDNKEDYIDKEVSDDIPNIDEFVDKVVKKTYEKNEQFSSVYVDNDQNVDSSNDEEINNEEDTSNNIENVEVKEEITEENNEQTELQETEEQIDDKLYNLKKALDEKQTGMGLADLKAKLDNLNKEKSNK